MQTLVNYAKTILEADENRFSEFPIYLKATAGMRILPNDRRENILNWIANSFSNATIVSAFLFLSFSLYALWCCDVFTLHRIHFVSIPPTPLSLRERKRLHSIGWASISFITHWSIIIVIQQLMVHSIWEDNPPRLHLLQNLVPIF